MHSPALFTLDHILVPNYIGNIIHISKALSQTNKYDYKCKYIFIYVYSVTIDFLIYYCCGAPPSTLNCGVVVGGCNII